MNPWLFLTLALWIPHWRLLRVLAAPFPAAWERILERNMEVYAKLPPPLLGGEHSYSSWAGVLSAEFEVLQAYYRIDPREWQPQ